MLRCDVVERQGDVVVLGLDGDLVDEEPLGSLERALEDQYVDNGVKRIALELESLRTIDLEGIGMLLTLRRRAERKGKLLTVRGAEGSVRAKLRTTGVLRFLEDPS
jgi:anti-anti-sigma factor